MAVAGSVLQRELLLLPDMFPSTEACLCIYVIYAAVTQAAWWECIYWILLAAWFWAVLWLLSV